MSDPISSDAQPLDRAPSDGTTANGSPRHPLYVRGDAEPVPFAHCPAEADWRLERAA